MKRKPTCPLALLHNDDNVINTAPSKKKCDLIVPIPRQRIHSELPTVKTRSLE